MTLEIVSVERRWFQFENDDAARLLHPEESAMVEQEEILEIGFDFSTLSDGSVMGDCAAHFRHAEGRT